MHTLHVDRNSAAPLRKLDSTVVLERLDSTASSAVYLRQETALSNPFDESGRGSGRPEDLVAVSPTVLALSIRFGRLGAVTAVVVGCLMALTIVFNRGVELGHFDPTEKDDDAKKKLLDDYNSYTGNVAALFGKPIELFVALAAQLVLLRVLTASVLRARMSWKVDALALVLSASVGFLLSNSLNALNVQVQPPTIEAVISAGDLRYVPDASMTDSSARSTNLTHTFSERSAKNPITNTVLRNLVLPRVSATAPYCDWSTNQNAVSTRPLPDLVLEYGISQRDWQGRLLQEALEPKRLSVAVNATIKIANQSVSAANLPMSAALAAELFVYSNFISSHMFPWPRGVSALSEPEDINARYPGGLNVTDSVARVTGLLPPTNQALEETAQREWFLRESGAALMRLMDGYNTSRTDVLMEFSHHDISPTVRFDAITIEFDVDPMGFPDTKRTKDNSTRYTNVTPRNQCGPWPMRCMMPKPLFVPHDDPTVYDSPAQVLAFGSCVNAQGTEGLIVANLSDPYDLKGKLDCQKVSNSSLMVMSLGKRFAAESISENKIAKESGSVVDHSRESAVVKNLRRIYTFTVARLSWELSDLTDEFSAKCATDSRISCHGLRFPLAPSAMNPEQQQEIIVGVDALPMNLVTPPTLELRPRFLPLVKLHEPSQTEIFSGQMFEAFSGDPLLPHNMGDITWDMHEPPMDKYACNVFLEDRLQLILNNHMYIEHGLQTAYTAATFFLLQNGVVKDVVKLNDEAQRQSLNFQQNKQRVTLLASIPNQNAWLTLSGCVVLLLSLGSVVLWAWATSSSNSTPTKDGRCGGLGLVMTPHVVARVMMDSVHFPPMFLHRRVVGVSAHDVDEGEEPLPSVERFVIDGLSLQPSSALNAAA